MSASVSSFVTVFWIMVDNLAGDLERKFDLEISPLCNQQADSVPAIQIGEYWACKYTLNQNLQEHLMISKQNHHREHMRLHACLTEDVPVCQVLSPTLWSLCSRSGTASPSPAYSAKLCWVTCTRTRLAGVAYYTHTHLLTHKQTPTLRSPLQEEEMEKTSPNFLVVSLGVLPSSINGGEESLCYSLHISSQSWLLTGSKVGALEASLTWIHEKYLPLLEAEHCKKKLNKERQIAGGADGRIILVNKCKFLVMPCSLTLSYLLQIYWEKQE